MAFTRCRGAFTSAELALLQRGFDQLCKERCLAIKDEDQRDQLACDVIQTFENGLIDEAELCQSLSGRTGA